MSDTVDQFPRETLDTEELILQVRDHIETARSVPMSASVMVNRDELVTLLEDAVAALPEEIRQARWLLKEREEFLAKARREAEDIIDAGRQQAQRMVEKTEVVREAEKTSRDLKHEAEDYIDRKLASFEVVLERTMTAVAKGRERLQVVIPEEAAALEEDVDDANFFDQDLA